MKRSTGARTIKACPRSRGFALVVALILMVLITVIALGLLSLSSIEVRNGARENSMMTARANARFGMMMALGQLQSLAGPDQRITASADILERSGTLSRQPKITGVWKSWENLNNRLTTAPSSPFETEKQKRFLGWLTSVADNTTPGLHENAPPANAILLAGSDNGTGDNLPVKADRILLKGAEGGYSYAVLDEGIKANIALPDEVTPATAVERVIHFGTAARSAQEALGAPFDSVTAKAAGLVKTCSTSTYMLNSSTVKKTDMAKQFHAITTESQGLLTDVNEGGFKVDLSIATEENATPPTVVTGVNLSAPNYSMQWARLFQYARQYKALTFPNGESATCASLFTGAGGNDIPRAPLLARVQYILSYRANAVAANPALFTVGLVITPVVTLWNPYNVEIVVNGAPKYNIASLPFSLGFKVGTKSFPLRHFTLIAKRGGGVNEPVFNFALNPPSGSTTTTLKPGESKVFSPTSTALVSSGATLGMTPGYRKDGGFFYSRDLTGTGTDITATAAETMSVEIMPDVSQDDFQDWNVAYHCDAYMGSVQFEATRMNARDDSLTRYIPTIGHSDSRKVTVGSASTNQVCASMNVQLRTPADAVARSLGYAQSNPFVVRSEYGRRDVNVGTVGGTFPQPLSLCWVDIMLHAHAGWNDSYLPQIDPENHGFVASGIRADTGVPYSQLSEIPLRPMQSLVALQHFNYAARCLTESAYHVIGNSLANPTVPPGDTRAGPTNGGVAMHQDLSYNANALLFDKFFFSSIAPRASTLSASPSESQTAVYEAHRTNQKPLPNSRYKPYGITKTTDIQSASSPATTIASRLTVAGAFNVNSTSVGAWKVMLGSLNKERPAYHNLYGPSTGNLIVADERPYVVSRFGLPGGACADHDPSQTGQIPEELFWRGYRSLTQLQIDALAESIVRQVKQRGPFLSLAEFVNRRLSASAEDKPYCARGAIQAALDDPAVTINDSMKAAGHLITSAEIAGYEGYVFPEAALGYTTFAAPGWVTQADLLRPLAPYLAPRSDTFRIRAYGDAMDQNGNIVARAWCESVVQRLPEFVDASQATTTAVASLNATNLRYGRRFSIVSFRWMSKDEIQSPI